MIPAVVCHITARDPQAIKGLRTRKTFVTAVTIATSMTNMAVFSVGIFPLVPENVGGFVSSTRRLSVPPRPNSLTPLTTKTHQMAETAYRNALLWAFDRLSIDGGMTVKEQRRTMLEIGNVLCGRPSPASVYQPNDWDDSVALTLKEKPHG